MCLNLTRCDVIAMTTDLYRCQHAQIMLRLMQLEALVAQCDIVAHAAAFRERIADLCCRLATHCAAEDSLLYPQLLDQADAAGKALAKRFEEEMVCMMQVFRDYARRWQVADAIEARPTNFRVESLDLTTSLIERIRLENEQLLPLADEVSERPREHRSSLGRRAQLLSLPSLMLASGA